VARNPDARIRDIATAVGVTDRAAQTILNELVEAGYLARSRHGRRNRYRLDAKRPLRHPIEQEHAIGDLLAALDAMPDRPDG
jgi:predicted transcriptional regulator